MPKKEKKRFEVYLDPRLKPILEECLNDENVRKKLILRQLKEDASGVAKLAVYEFVLSIHKNRASDTQKNRKG